MTRQSILRSRIHSLESPHLTYVDDSWPIIWKEAHGYKIRDVDDNEYIDLQSAFGVASIGHSNPEVITAIQKQSEKLIHAMGDVHPAEIKLLFLEKLLQEVPPQLDRALIVNSGSEAIEVALRTAYYYTKKRGVIAFSGSYHGLSLGALPTTSRRDFRNKGISESHPSITHLPYANCHHCPFNQSFPSCNWSCVSYLDWYIKSNISGSSDIGAILLEPIQGRGGEIVPPPGYLSKIGEICKKYNVIYILDEIFTGFYRTGPKFAFEAEHIVPDILCIGKALGGGMPIGTCLTSSEIMNSWGISSGEAIYTSTFISHPLSCAAAYAALDELNRYAPQVSEIEKILREVFLTENKYTAMPLDTNFFLIRGRGAMWGLECLGNGKKTGPEIANEIVRKMLELYYIILQSGPYGETISLIPPFCIDLEEWRIALLKLKEICISYIQ